MRNRFLSVLASALVLFATSANAQQPQPPKIVTFTIDAKRDVHPISRYIYGINQFHLYVDGLEGAFSNLSFTRLGGNRFTAYNWTNNASQAGSDYHFQNDAYLVLGDMFKGVEDKPGGAILPIAKIASDHQAGFLLTVPINGLVAADREPTIEDVTKVPDYLTKCFKPIKARKGSEFTLTPDPKAPVVYADEFANWVKQTLGYGLTDPNRPIWFSLDNEPDWWSHTHKEIHPQPASYAEIMEKTIDFAGAIKDVIPEAVVFGPVNYGWQGYVRFQDAPDAKDRDFHTFYLQELKKAEQKTGKRLVDVLDVHFYPEAQSATGQRIIYSGGNMTDPQTVEARLQAPRSLWDPTYTEKSWITEKQLHAPIQLIPRLKKKIDSYYPGTKLAITEYEYGGGNHISGGITQADVLGIFGREGVFAAALWAGKDIPYFGGAFEMFRNFDGNNATFGDTSIHAVTSDVAASSVYASLDSADASRMVLVAINKTDQPITATLNLANAGAYKSADVFQLTASGPAPKPAGTLQVNDPKRFTYTMPAYSVSTLRLASK